MMKTETDSGENLEEFPEDSNQPVEDLPLCSDSGDPLDEEDPEQKQGLLSDPNNPMDPANDQAVDDPTQEELSFSFNIEWLRILGLSAIIVMIVVGRVLSDSWPGVWGRYNNPKSVEDTYIWKVFGFAHTCVYIDFNPAKSYAALIVLWGVAPLILFTVLQNWRIQLAAKKREIKPDIWVLAFSNWTCNFKVLCYAYFFMVFVNSPDEPFTDPQTIEEKWADLGWRHFFFHYLPFMFFQIALSLMAIEQTWFQFEKGTVPFGITKPYLRMYTVFIALFGFYYHLYVWAHMFGFGIPGKYNLPLSKFVMYFFLVLNSIIPILMGIVYVKGWGGYTPVKNTIRFY